MTNEHKCLLSVLIPTLETRAAMYKRLREEIQRQIEESNSAGLVEVLSLRDNGTGTIGAKRNQLIGEARGLFVVFIDDDDTISKNYIKRIIETIRDNTNADCISFVGEITFRGKHPRKMVHSIKHKDWLCSNGEYVRPPCHITPIRRQIAASYRFASKDIAEDMDWALRMSLDGVLKREVVLDEVLYFYHCRRSYFYQWLLDRTQTMRHALNLRFAKPGKMISGKPTLLFISNDFYASGGGNCVVAWSLMALRKHWDITLFCAKVPNLDEINKHFGTDLKVQDFRIRKLPFPLSEINHLDPDPFSIQRGAWLMRLCKRQSQKFDAVMSCSDEFDFGRRGIQYTHYPYMQRHIDTFLSLEGLSSGQRWRKFFIGKLRPWLLISGITLEAIKNNLMVTNSNWTADVIREVYGVESLVVYPPVRWEGPERPVEERRNSFVALGRLSPAKRYLEIIDIIEQVRARGFAIELEIIGDEDTVAGDDYVQEIRNRIATAGDWVRLNKSISRIELENLVSQCRFGIHGMIDEHFGIAPAELMRGGCVVFVQNSGGQVEIVGENPELRYGSDSDAVEKICRVLSDQETQSRLRQSLHERSALFGESHFMCQMQNIAKDFLNEK
jgi:glycosyltransferase involved in cell wall biosynthesis